MRITRLITANTQSPLRFAGAVNRRESGTSDKVRFVRDRASPRSRDLGRCTTHRNAMPLDGAGTAGLPNGSARARHRRRRLACPLRVRRSPLSRVFLLSRSFDRYLRKQWYATSKRHSNCEHVTQTAPRVCPVDVRAVRSKNYRGRRIFVQFARQNE